MSHLGDDSLSVIRFESEKVDAADVTFKRPLSPSKMHKPLHIQNFNVSTQLKKDNMDINIFSTCSFPQQDSFLHLITIVLRPLYKQLCSP